MLLVVLMMVVVVKNLQNTDCLLNSETIVYYKRQFRSTIFKLQRQTMNRNQSQWRNKGGCPPQAAFLRRKHFFLFTFFFLRTAIQSQKLIKEKYFLKGQSIYCHFNSLIKSITNFRAGLTL